MDSNGPFNFDWGVDQDGYDLRQQRPGLISEVEVEFVVGRGGPERRYRPLEDHPALWLQFGETCQNAEGVLDFASRFGLLHKPNRQAYGPLGLMSLGPGDRLTDTLEFADRARNISRLLDEHNRVGAIELFNLERPTVTEHIVWKPDRGRFDYRWVPISLRDALLHQIGDAITQNRQFRRCGNTGCPKWFRLGPQEAQKGGGRRTTTVRKRFCSDYCRVAAARRQKREVAIHA